MARPRLLDLFCGAGGAARGYQQAGFYVVGVDINPQPRYAGDEFHQADALDFPLDGYDAIHASPPCQHYAAVTRWRGRREDHPDLYDTIAARLRASGVPWVIENVPGAPFEPDLVLCGSQFGLPFRRHRWFIGSPTLFQLVPTCRHSDDDYSFDHGGKQAESVYRDAMGCGWMTVAESREAIPPVYTEHIGRQLYTHLTAGVAS